MQNMPQYGDQKLRGVIALIRFMRQRFPRQHLRLSAIAREAGVAESTLSRAFATHLQRSPWAVLTDIRLDAASDIARAEPHQSWSTIAERCGFGDYRHFARLFSRRFGCPPSRWSTR